MSDYGLSSLSSLATLVDKPSVHFGTEFVVHTSTIPLPTVIQRGWFRARGHDFTDIDHTCQDCCLAGGTRHYKLDCNEQTRTTIDGKRSKAICFMEFLSGLSKDPGLAEKTSISPDHLDLLSSDYPPELRLKVGCSSWKDISNFDELAKAIGQTQWGRYGRYKQIPFCTFPRISTIEAAKAAFKNSIITVSGLIGKYIMAYPEVIQSYSRLANYQKSLIYTLTFENLKGKTDLFDQIKAMSKKAFRIIQGNKWNFNDEDGLLGQFLYPYRKVDELRSSMTPYSLEDYAVFSILTQGRFVGKPPPAKVQETIDTWKQVCFRDTKLDPGRRALAVEGVRLYIRDLDESFDHYEWFDYGSFRAKPSASILKTRDQQGKLEDYREALSDLYKVPIRDLETLAVVGYEGREWIEDNPLKAYFCYALEVAISQTYEEGVPWPNTTIDVSKAMDLNDLDLIFPTEPGKARPLTKGSAEAYVLTMPMAKALLCALALDPDCTVGILGADHAYYHRRRVFEDPYWFREDSRLKDLNNFCTDMKSSTDYADRDTGIEMLELFGERCKIPSAYMDLVLEIESRPKRVNHAGSVKMMPNTWPMGNPLTKVVLTLEEKSALCLSEEFCRMNGMSKSPEERPRKTAYQAMQESRIETLSQLSGQGEKSGQSYFDPFDFAASFSSQGYYHRE